MSRSRKWTLGVLGFLLIAACVWAYLLSNLRRHTIPFEYLFFSAFILYGIACFLALGTGKDIDRRVIFGILGVALVMQAPLVFMHPTLSDDMYRYVWDGRVQAQGISPYRYPPGASELTSLRDNKIYPFINRKPAVTIYPPAAEAAFALLWRIWPDNVHWFQAAMAAGGLLAGALLLGLLRDLGLSPARALIYLWSPLLAFETAHSAHVDGLLLPLLVGAWWARVRERDGLTGFLLGIAAAMKLYPALLLPFLWRPRHPQGRWRMPLAFGLTVGLFYLPYVLASGQGVLGYLPHYIEEMFNVSPLVSALNHMLDAFKLGLPNMLIPLALGIILIAAGWAMAHPASDAKTALRRCILPMGVLTLLSQDLFSWYMLWLLPLVAIFLTPSDKGLGFLKFPRLDAWTGWWLFCGLVGLSYTVFINGRPVRAAILAQFLPLYLFLLIDFMRFHGIRALAVKYSS
jgi:alpha-1,6-mannosyltransferase